MVPFVAKNSTTGVRGGIGSIVSAMTPLAVMFVTLFASPYPFLLAVKLYSVVLRLVVALRQYRSRITSVSPEPSVMPLVAFVEPFLTVTFAPLTAVSTVEFTRTTTMFSTRANTSPARFVCAFSVVMFTVELRNVTFPVV
jgi:hypothetical protein